jgi:hypothetical protein
MCCECVVAGEKRVRDFAAGACGSFDGAWMRKVLARDVGSSFLWPDDGPSWPFVLFNANLMQEKEAALYNLIISSMTFNLRSELDSFSSKILAREREAEQEGVLLLR